MIRGDSGDVHTIDQVHISQQWRAGSLANDVALLRTTNLPKDAVPLRLADAAQLAALTRGTVVATFGFPAISTHPARPRGRLAVDVVGDVRDGHYIAVGLRVAPGASGSPIFLHNGVVVGVVSGGDFVEDPTGERSPTGTNVNWGISITPLQQLIRECQTASR